VTPVSAAEFQRLREIKKEIDPDGKYLGESLPILRVFEDIERLNADPDAPILILGATGVGKSEIANLIHKHSSRKAKPFLRESAPTSMSGDPLVWRGNWTGYGDNPGIRGIPSGGRKGLLQGCAGGTIFLDEVADLSHEFQLLLLDVLDKKPISLATGEGEQFVPDVRLIFATNKDLSHLAGKRKFRHDLYDRMRRRTITIPSLAARQDDIFAFVRMRCSAKKPTFGFRLCLLRHCWKNGNIRELLDVLKDANDRAGRSNSRTIEHLQSIPEPERVAVQQLPEESQKQEVLEFLVRTLTRQGLAKGQGLNKRMAEILDVSASTVSRSLSPSFNTNCPSP
jgi:transcriptional regulator with PAS, ATPase and Fis domain